jgi:hypothetical protein
MDSLNCELANFIGDEIFYKLERSKFLNNKPDDLN